MQVVMGGFARVKVLLDLLITQKYVVTDMRQMCVANDVV